MGKKILLACGGTGGHIFPAFSVAEEIKKRFPGSEVSYAYGKKDIESAIFGLISNEKVYSVESAPFRGIHSLLDLSFLLRLWRGFCLSVSILKEEKPDIVVGFGGHYSFPVIVAAKWLKIPTMIHEQNVYPGMANKVLMRLADAVALSFSQSRQYLPLHKNIRVTGNPIRASIERECRKEALSFFGFSPERVTMLVLGGSQGAESINTCYLKALAFLPVELRSRLQVLHLCGRMNPQEAMAEAGRSGVISKAFSFFDRMDLAYGAVDFAIGRAGATFLAEIKAKKIPAILIPYPFAGGHQLLNAAAFLEDEKSIVIEQKDLTPEKMAEVLEQFVKRVSGQPIFGGGDLPPNHSRVSLTEFIEECAGWR